MSFRLAALAWGLFYFATWDIRAAYCCALCVIVMPVRSGKT